MMPDVAADAARLSASNQAPLGRPVVPLVNTMVTGSDLLITTTGTVPASKSAVLQASARDITGYPPGASGSPACGSRITSVGRARAKIASVSRGPSLGLMPVVTAPSSATAAKHTA